MNDMFTDPDFPMEKSKGYNAMAVNKRFTREQCILLGSKINLLISVVRDVDKQEVNKIMTQIAKMSYREAYNFLKHYKAFLRGEYDIEEGDESTVNLSGRGDYKEQVNVTFKMPELKVVKGKKIELKFEDEWEEQVYALALAKLEKRIQQEIANILNSDEYDNYRKLAEKKYKD
jgi:hypothetical protein